MPVTVNDRGKGNRVVLHPWFETNGKLAITFKGDNNLVQIAEAPISCHGMVIEFGAACSFTAGKGVGLTNTYVFGGKSAHITIGESTTLHTRGRFILHEPSRVTLGPDCMVASDVQFMTSDAHSILDATTRRRINPAKDIVIGAHVWLGLQTMVLKGAVIGANAVIGFRSVVTGEIPAGCLATGSPARVLRDNIDWDRKLIEDAGHSPL